MHKRSFNTIVIHSLIRQIHSVDQPCLQRKSDYTNLAIYPLLTKVVNLTETYI